jgi:hypothetical protein
VIQRLHLIFETFDHRYIIVSGICAFSGQRMPSAMC